MHFDIFNGDADGILSLLQLRKAHPQDSVLVTGVKRDIRLLDTVDVSDGDTLTVLDISMEKNQQGLHRLLPQAKQIFYADHHKSGDIPVSDKLEAHIDLDANICTALIVDRYLQGQYHSWAITAAFGDNLNAVAQRLSSLAGYSSEEAKQLEELGILLNYNGYGHHLDDLHYHPAELYQLLMEYESPFEVISDLSSPFYSLRTGYQSDFQAVSELMPVYNSRYLSVIELPDAVFSRRISGVFGNYLANEFPDRAHIILTRNEDTSFRISLRAPLNNKQGAGDICSDFPTGGGRAAAAGVNALPEHILERFIARTESYYSGKSV
ncbi:hypothetical protein VA7868_01976 [Vibrio aerogenes CECT 7868]|uniref:DHHA1 domain protein n=1 Tax=Vibrio aerogenes CECT 7868 TaxID=1216006 RepID=A0A1M5YT65_9VIBR|nr:acetyltransferase [Vibrio aerogenes]SHI15272.1 hypothetical protein VA7868_01976 [Vibrio aerogenes CECT 7868]